MPRKGTKDLTASPDPALPSRRVAIAKSPIPVSGFGETGIRSRESNHANTGYKAVHGQLPDTVSAKQSYDQLFGDRRTNYVPPKPRSAG
jgi:hypothetical protein